MTGCLLDVTIFEVYSLKLSKNSLCYEIIVSLFPLCDVTNLKLRKCSTASCGSERRVNGLGMKAPTD